VAEFTRPATWEDVKRLAQYFEQEGVEYALIGGYGLAAHGLARFTEDIDVLPAAAGHAWNDLKQHITQVEIDGVRINVLTLEGLLKTKQVARPRDQADAEAIERAIKLLRERK
jgi:hypothetical protein